MRGDRFHRASGVAMMGLALLALLLVLSAFRVSFDPFAVSTQPPQEDEGLQAHLFQLALLALVPTTLMYLVSADWRKAGSTARPLGIMALLVGAALALLAYAERPR